MALDHLKKPFVNSLHSYVAQRLNDALQKVGKFLPVSVVSVANAIATIKFEISDPVFTLPGSVQVPWAGSEYIRPPIQALDKGMVIAGDASLAQTAGMAAGTADLSTQANLESLVLLPISSTKWPQTPDPMAAFLYGFDGHGVWLQDTATGSKISLKVNGTAGFLCTLSGSLPAVFTKGGTPSPVMTVAGPSTVLKADA